MSRHGESLNNMLNIIGGDSHISEKGEEYSELLGEYFESTPNLIVWTSDLKRTKETTSAIHTTQIVLKNLNEIYAGDFDGYVLDDIKQRYPVIYHKRNSDKLNKWRELFRFTKTGD